jgi:hypothetical protein
MDYGDRITSVRLIVEEIQLVRGLASLLYGKSDGLLSPAGGGLGSTPKRER